MIVVRAGVPQTGGALVHAAIEANIPVLFSANAFAKTSVQGDFAGFSLTAAQRLPETLDAALDSAGFVAAVRYGRYRWTTEQYYDLVTARPWAWHAAMDYCVEPPVAGALSIRLMRLNATAHGYFCCVNEAKRRNAQMPMPVLQGWFAEDYLRCADLMAIQDWPDMVGIGSVCRRNVAGAGGIASVIETLDRYLPPHVRFHLFGVKGGAVQDLGDHPRFASIDSMAWDFSVRCQSRTGRTQSMRIDAMLKWQDTQAQIEPTPWAKRILTERLPNSNAQPQSLRERVDEAVVAWYADMLLADHGYSDCNHHAHSDADRLTLQIQTFGLESLQDIEEGPAQAVYEALSA